MRFMNSPSLLGSDRAYSTVELPGQGSRPAPLPSVLLEKQSVYVYCDHYWDIRTVRQRERLEDVTGVVFVRIENTSENCRALQLSVHQHIDGANGCAVLAYADFFFQAEDGIRDGLL